MRTKAGADLNELAKISTGEAYRTGWLKDLETNFSTFRKPVIAAVRGFAVRISPCSFYGDECSEITE
jgi:enoyl-CoA hydratase/carnithine racemase